MRKFITEKIGSEYIHRTGTNLREPYKESSARTPLILTHSHGKLLVNSEDDRAVLVTRHREVGPMSAYSMFKVFSHSYLIIWERENF